MALMSNILENLRFIWNFEPGKLGGIYFLHIFQNKVYQKKINPKINNKKLYGGNLANPVFQTTPPNEPAYAIYFFR